MSRETIDEKATRLICQRRIDVVYADDRRAELEIQGDTFIDTGLDEDLRHVKLYEDGTATCDCPNVLFVGGAPGCSHVVAAKRVWKPAKDRISLEKLNAMMYPDDTIDLG